MAADDVPAVRALHAASFAALARDWHTPAEIAGHLAWIAAEAYADELARCRMTLAWRDGELVATAGWMALTETPDAARIRKVFVHPRAARRGLGSLLVRRAERAARWAGRYRLIVRANVNAVPLYARLGYVPTGHDAMVVADGVRLPVVMMEKLSD